MQMRKSEIALKKALIPMGLALVLTMGVFIVAHTFKQVSANEDEDRKEIFLNENGQSVEEIEEDEYISVPSREARGYPVGSNIFVIPHDENDYDDEGNIIQKGIELPEGTYSFALPDFKDNYDEFSTFPSCLSVYVHTDKFFIPINESNHDDFICRACRDTEFVPDGEYWCAYQLDCGLCVSCEFFS